MPYDPSAQPINQPRRKDRAIDDPAWIEDFLRRAPVASIATEAGGQPFLHNNLFAYDPVSHAIYFHTAKEGRARSNIDANPRVCLSVYEMGRLLPANTALEFSVEYASVIVFGCAIVIDEPAEAARCLQLLLDKYFPDRKPGADYRPIQPEELARTAVFRIDIDSWSGKRKKV
jgi:nitroimidazol reductase NimA-like FMN-containing flavoprotein (pyridoxamine 5'-phosphate oxidase superfamily)